MLIIKALNLRFAFTYCTIYMELQLTVSMCTDPTYLRTVGFESFLPYFPFLIEFVFVRTYKANNATRMSRLKIINLLYSYFLSRLISGVPILILFSSHTICSYSTINWCRLQSC